MLSFSALAPPLCLCLVAAIAQKSGAPRIFADRAIVGASAAFATSLALALAVAANGAFRSPLLGLSGVGLSIHLDALSAIMLVLVSFVGVAVVRYSRNYLDGDPGHARFTQWLVLTLAAVQTLVIAGNLAFLIVAWIATSVGLGKLLLFYGDRPAAQRAARKKFIASRLGDLCLTGASVLLYARFGTMEIADILTAAKAADAASWTVTIAGLLVVTTATLKSAQLPLHGWILEVMETPTPVSALLHAGIVNAGGFLVLRLADVLLLAGPSLEVLAITGGATALFGSLVMLTQTSVKVQLAYSTIAQMGFMLLQCGLGAFSSALLHIVAHSLYKAHAFLSSGSVMDLARASWSPSPGGAPHPARLVLALAGVLAITVGVALLFGMTPGNSPAKVALGCILLMGLVHLLAGAIDQRPNAFVVTYALATSAGIAVLYFSLQAATAFLVDGSVPVASQSDNPVEKAVAGLAVVSFAAVTVFQNQMMRRASSPFWLGAYIHLKNGLYLNTIANRLVLALWPRRGRLL
ncbi:MAG: NADH-quinone oxidoreductase subunit L [Beijerinckiaceae bacterium]